ncbi:DUF2236 domain-containing protein [Nocardioidaceae bacterium]|nr:DUF2236 domain-containing protein [Nocardioidaceae bacterium]
MERDFWLRRIATLDPVQDAHEIYRISALHELPWDTNQALSFALFRTYAVPSIGSLLAATGEFTERVQKRYDDTGLLLDEVMAHGLGPGPGRRAVKRINQMHAMYDIADDDMLYVLSTFVTVPIRWMDDHAWRPMTEAEKVAASTYYTDLGEHMGIRGIPDGWRDFGELMDAYERQHFAYDPGARAVADATLELMCTFPPNHLAPSAAVKRFSYALMDGPLLDAFGYPHPAAWERRAARAALRARSAYVRRTAPRTSSFRFADLPGSRSYPHGYDIEGLGTHRPATLGCPVVHHA